MPPVQIIPPLLQLYPEIEVEHADETPNLLRRAASGKWTWLFAGRTVYLVAPPLEEGDGGLGHVLHTMRVMHSEHIAPLLKFYLSETRQ